MKLLINKPNISNLEKKYVSDVLNKGWLSAGGEHTTIFEKKFANFLNLKYAFAVQSGTAALHTALKAAGVEKGDRVITPNFTCLSNISTISQCNAVPIVVEIERDTLGLDYDLVMIAIEKYKPKVLQLVHVYGHPARDTKKIINLCKKNKIIVIEDSSESFGAEINGVKTGTFGDINVTSVRSEKMIGVGEGGIISTNNKYLFERANLYASRKAPYRKSTNPYWKKYFAEGEGYNYRMPHLLGALGRAQVERFSKELLPKKINIGLMYRKIFKNNNFEFTQKILKNNKPSFWLNSLYFKNFSKKQVVSIGNKLMKLGIEVRSGFWPLNQQKGFKPKFVKKELVSDDIFKRTLVLPSSYDLKIKDIKFIKKYLIKIIQSI